MIGKFRKPPARVTLPIAIILHLALLFFAGIVALAALIQPILLILGRVEGGAGQAALNFLALGAAAIGLVVLDRLIQKMAVWVQP